MSYDKKTGTIGVTSGSQDELHNDVLAHFAHVLEDLESGQNGKAPERPVAPVRVARVFNEHGPVVHKPDRLSGNRLKWLAIILNLALVALVSWFVLEEGLDDGSELLAYAILFGAPIVSIVALARSGGDSSLGHCFKRRHS